jgi:hypothetical protein
MSGTRRTPLHRERHPVFGAEAVALFWKLELTPPRRRNRDDERQLARLLHLTNEWWTCNSVLDRGGPCHPSGSGYIANVDWRRCRAVRKRLLATIAPAA